MGQLLNHLARMTGESMRIKKTAKQEQNISPEIQQKVELITH